MHLSLERQRKTRAPCPGCGIHLDRCLCADIPRLTLRRTFVDVLIHAREMKRTTNTGQLAVSAIEHARLLVRGQMGAPLKMQEYVRPECVGLILFPAPDAVELTDDLVRSFGDRPVQLIVPDGNWRQAAKVLNRHSEISNYIPVIVKPVLSVPRATLRHEHTEFGMSTLEGIAHALTILEGELAGTTLLDLFRLKLERTLAGRPPTKVLPPKFRGQAGT